jgi:HEAT repeat protein/S1-C subfamily serine protease
LAGGCLSYLLVWGIYSAFHKPSADNAAPAEARAAPREPAADRPRAVVRPAAEARPAFEPLLPQDTRFVLGIHVKAITESTLYQKSLKNQFRPWFDRLGDAQLMQMLLGLDPLRDITELRIAAPSTHLLDLRRELVICRGRFDAARLRAGLEKMPGAKLIPVPGAKDACKLFELRANKDAPPTYFAVVDDTCLVFGGTQEPVIEALQRANGEHRDVLPTKALRDLLDGLDRKQAVWFAALGSGLVSPEGIDLKAFAIESVVGGIEVGDGLKLDLRIATTDADHATAALRDLAVAIKQLKDRLKVPRGEDDGSASLVEIVQTLRATTEGRTVILTADVPPEPIARLARIPWDRPPARPPAQPARGGNALGPGPVVAMPPAPANDGMPADQIYDRLLRSTVFIVATSTRGNATRVWVGSGSLVHQQQKLVVTNHHVAADADQILVFFPVFEGDTPITNPAHYRENIQKLGIPAHVVADDSTRDLALLQLNVVPSQARVLPLARQSPRPGHTVYSIGNSSVSTGSLWRYTIGQVRQLRLMEEQVDGRLFRAMVVDTQSPINPGDSGGPMVNEHVELVAVVASFRAGQRLVSMSIDVREVRSLLQQHFQGRGLQWVETAPVRPGNVSRLTQLVTELGSANAQVRLRAIAALGEMGRDARPALPGLVCALKEPDEVLSRSARQALEKVTPLTAAETPFLAGLLRDEDPRARRYAIVALGGLGPAAKPAVPGLIAALQDAAPECRPEAIRALGLIGPNAHAAFPPLRSILTSQDRAQARLAAESLARLGEPDRADWDGWRALLDDPRVEVRLGAAAVVARMGPDPRPWRVLFQTLGDQDPEVRLLTQHVLGPLPRQALMNSAAKLPDQVAVVTPLLEHADSTVRCLGLTILGCLGAPARSSSAQIIKALGNADPVTRLSAAWTLGQIGAARETVLALGKALHDKDERVVLQAAASLGTLGPAAKDAADALASSLGTNSRLNKAIVDALVQMGKPAVPALMRGLENRLPQARVASAEGLGRLGSDARQAVPRLVGVMNFDSFPEARRAAGQALNKIPH